MPTSLQLTEWLRDEIERAKADFNATSNKESNAYSEGEFDAFNAVLAKMLGKEIN